MDKIGFDFLKFDIIHVYLPLTYNASFVSEKTQKRIEYKIVLKDNNATSNHSFT